MKRDIASSASDAITFPALLKQPRFSPFIVNLALSGKRQSRSTHLMLRPSCVAGPSIEINNGSQPRIVQRPSHADEIQISTVSVLIV